MLRAQRCVHPCTCLALVLVRAQVLFGHSDTLVARPLGHNSRGEHWLRWAEVSAADVVVLGATAHVCERHPRLQPSPLLHPLPPPLPTHPLSLCLSNSPLTHPSLTPHSPLTHPLTHTHPLLTPVARRGAQTAPPTSAVSYTRWPTPQERGRACSSYGRPARQAAAARDLSRVCRRTRRRPSSLSSGVSFGSATRWLTRTLRVTPRRCECSTSSRYTTGWTHTSSPAPTACTCASPAR